jgi:UDP-2-acetamido-3-amino-2,3-dideoxy-glucuronate N-acetyltransferase
LRVKRNWAKNEDRLLGGARKVRNELDSRKIAVVGAGYWGRNLVRNYLEIGALKCVCDTRSEALGEVKKNYPEVEMTERFEAVLEDNSIRGVVVAVPAEHHYELSAAALKAGKDVFVEKPLALNLADARELNRLALEKGRVLMVGHLLRYHPAFVKLSELVANGNLGRLEYVYSTRLSLGKIRREENSLWSFAPHDISMILALCNEMPDGVVTVGHNYLHRDLADVTTTHLTFASGINAHIFVSWLHPFKEQKLVVIGDRKMAVFEDTQPWDKKLVLYAHSIRWQKGMPIPEKGEPEYVLVEKGEPLRIECLHFLDCIEKRQTPVTDGNEGYRVLNVLDKSQKAMTGHWKSHGERSEAESGRKYFVHSSAFVDEPCEIGAGTKIWHFSHVMNGAKIGEKCNIGQNVNIANDVRIGNNVKIQNNVSVYTGTVIEDDVFLGPSCVLTNVTNPRAQINRHSLYEKTTIRKGATVGANATVLCGVTIGRYAFIAAGSVLTSDAPDYALMVGSPARRVGWMSRHGIRLNSPDSEGVMVCAESGLRYKEMKEDLLRCMDLDEEVSLPAEMAVGKVSYDELKKTVQNGFNGKSAAIGGNG